MNMRDDVFDFIAAVGQVDGYTGRVADKRLVTVYENLVDEEYYEFINSTSDANKLNEAVDLVWVVLGYCIARGWDVQGAWEELTLANMSKVQVDETTGGIKRRADGKILKPDDWKTPNMSPFLNIKRSENHG